MDDSIRQKKPRGFATLTPERRKEISSMGGRSVPADKRTFSFNRELASTAGRKGGLNSSSELRSFSADRQLAATAGRAGGLATSKARAAHE